MSETTTPTLPFEAAYERLVAEQAEAFEALDARCEALTLDERELGRFERLS